MEDKCVRHRYCECTVEGVSCVEREVGVGERGGAGASHNVSRTADNETIEEYSEIDDCWGNREEGERKIGVREEGERDG